MTAGPVEGTIERTAEEAFSPMVAIEALRACNSGLSSDSLLKKAATCALLDYLIPYSASLDVWVVSDGKGIRGVFTDERLARYLMERLSGASMVANKLNVDWSDQ